MNGDNMNKGISVGEYLAKGNNLRLILNTIIAQEEQMKQIKDNLFNYLQNRVIALTTYIKSYEDMIKEYPETESVNRARIIATELQLEEINKVISYCEKRGRY